MRIYATNFTCKPTYKMQIKMHPLRKTATRKTPTYARPQPPSPNWTPDFSTHAESHITHPNHRISQREIPIDKLRITKHHLSGHHPPPNKTPLLSAPNYEKSPAEHAELGNAKWGCNRDAQMGRVHYTGSMAS
jgi:hypothetical protein